MLCILLVSVFHPASPFSLPYLLWVYFALLCRPLCDRLKKKFLLKFFKPGFLWLPGSDSLVVSHGWSGVVLKPLEAVRLPSFASWGGEHIQHSSSLHVCPRFYFWLYLQVSLCGCRRPQDQLAVCMWLGLSPNH